MVASKSSEPLIGELPVGGGQEEVEPRPPETAASRPGGAVTGGGRRDHPQDEHEDDRRGRDGVADRREDRAGHQRQNHRDDPDDDQPLTPGGQGGASTSRSPGEAAVSTTTWCLSKGATPGPRRLPDASSSRSTKICNRSSRRTACPDPVVSTASGRRSQCRASVRHHLVDEDGWKPLPGPAGPDAARGRHPHRRHRRRGCWPSSTCNIWADRRLVRRAQPTRVLRPSTISTSPIASDTPAMTVGPELTTRAYSSDSRASAWAGSRA